jgi:SAM-dependent methyltransferase
MAWGEAGSFPELYEALAVPAFFARFAEGLVDRAQLSGGEDVLDVATGTGVVARTIRTRGLPAGRVVGFDLTEAMVAVGRGAPGGQEVEWVIGDGHDLPFADGEFDVVLCQQGLQFYADPVAGARELRRVCDPDGRVLVACWQRDDSSLFEQVAETIGEVDGDLQQVARTPFSMTAERLGGILSEAGFGDVEVTLVEGEGSWASPEEAVRTFLEGTPLSLALASWEPDKVADLRARILDRARPDAAADGSLSTPMATHLALARP